MAMTSIGRKSACLRPERSCSHDLRQCFPLCLVGKAKANFTQRPGPVLSMCNCFQFPKEHSEDQHTLPGKPYSVHLPFVLLCCCENRSFFVALIAFLWDFGTSQEEFISLEMMDAISHMKKMKMRCRQLLPRALDVSLIRTSYRRAVLTL